MILDLSYLKEKLSLTIEYFDTIDSTSLYLKRLVKEQGDIPELVIAGFQTNGQGRVGRNFYSPTKTGLYLTFAIPVERIFCEDITPRVALCVSSAIDETFSVSTGIKWVNDIYFNEKKVSGVLCQKVENYYLIGIGINVEQPEYVPEELTGRFGSITTSCEDKMYTKLVCSLHDHLWQNFSKPKEDVLFQFREKCVHLNREVDVEYDQKILQGKCIGIDDDFSLLLEANGKTIKIQSGYMSLKI